ncbi:MAG: hypothetical protein GY786_06695 [Proteobacteria bacterium]|nr:hypothetical protein [Pseudomonadota bacterium]
MTFTDFLKFDVPVSQVIAFKLFVENKGASMAKVIKSFISYLKAKKSDSFGLGPEILNEFYSSGGVYHWLNLEPKDKGITSVMTSVD